MRLRHRFLLLVVTLLLLGAGAGYRLYTWYNQDIVLALGQRYVERNALFEKGQLLGLLTREVTLTEKMASSPLLKEWLADETHPARRTRALAELEDFRSFFRSRSYFFVIAGSGNYYYNDERGGHALETPRYTLSEKVLKDGWFYAALRSPKTVQLNVDTDRHLGITRIWINTVMRNAEGRGVAVTGTGLDLSEFISAFLRNAGSESVNLLIDEHGAVQAHPDQSLIDFGSTRKSETGELQRTLGMLLSSPQQREMLNQAMQELIAGQGLARSLVLDIQGRRQLVGLAWMPEIRWFVVSMVSPDAGASGSRLPQALLLLFLVVTSAVVVAAVRFDRVVLHRLGRLDSAAAQIGSGDYRVRIDDDSADEIGRLGRAVTQMAARVGNYTADLKQQVAERTAELLALSHSDPLTGLLNRRGMDERLRSELNRLRREQGRFALLQIDLDHFKQINDQHGHAAGDAVLAAVGRLLKGSVRDYDACARWGGEEFLVALFDIKNGQELAAAAEKLRAAVAELKVEYDALTLGLTCSIGTTLCSPQADLHTAMLRADAACYAAKSGGRNRVVAAAADL